uniref:TnsA endonuclease N-terminal domain-containing protein n=1 Tax=Sphingobium xenophagum TaxID=121428 RepID=UPI00036CDEAA
QKASPVRNRRQLTSLVSEVASRWTDEPLPPRPLSAVRGSISVPPRGPLVSFESSIERDFLMFCRTSHRVTAVYAQRLVIDFQDVKRGAARRYTPDFVVEVDAAAGLSWRRAVVEVKTQRDLWRSRRMMRAPYAAARTWAAGQEGTIFRVVTDRMMSGEWLASTRLLSGHLDKPCVAFLQQRDSYRISEILALAQQRGLNPQALLPALYRMVARGQLSLDRGQPIGPQTWVTVVGSQKRL